MSFLITLGLILLAIFLLVIFGIALITGIWQALSNLIANVVTLGIRAVIGAAGLLLFFWLLFKYFPHGYHIQ